MDGQPPVNGEDQAGLACPASRPRPKDAAALMLIDRSGPHYRVLVGRRSLRHVFMPDLYVFPGGRRDRADNSARCHAGFHPMTEQGLRQTLGHNAGARLRGLGICALRELFEETGLRACPNRAPDLSILRYVARAITPPGSVRRYDTHFFACFADELNSSMDALADSEELSDLRFIDTGGDPAINMPVITQAILGDLHSMVTSEPSLGFGGPIAFYAMRSGQFVRLKL